MLDLIFEFWRDTVFTWTDTDLDAYTTAIDAMVFILSMVTTIAVAVLLAGVVKWSLSFVFGLFGRYWL